MCRGPISFCFSGFLAYLDLISRTPRNPSKLALPAGARRLPRWRELHQVPRVLLEQNASARRKPPEAAQGGIKLDLWPGGFVFGSFLVSQKWLFPTVLKPRVEETRVWGLPGAEVEAPRVALTIPFVAVEHSPNHNLHGGNS